MPCGDVPSRVYVCVASVSAGGAPEDGLALTRLRVHPPARRTALTRERGIDLLHSAGGFLLQAADQQTHPDARMPRFSPAFRRTHRPGLVAVPLADRVMFVLRSRDDEPWAPVSFDQLADGTPYLYMSGRVARRVG